MYHFHVAEHDPKDWFTEFSTHTLREGLDCCSRRSVAFHYIDSALMKRMHAILYHCNDYNQKNRMLIPDGIDGDE